MQDLRLVELQEREAMEFGIREAVGTLVGGGVLMMVGLFAYSKIGKTIDQSGFTTAENTTLANIKSNIVSGFDLASVAFIVIAASVIIGIIYLAFR